MTPISFCPLSNTRTITLNGKRSIGRPQVRSRTRRDSLDDSLDGSDNENGNIETKNNEDNDVDMEEGAEDIEIPDDDGKVKTPFRFYCNILNVGRREGTKAMLVQCSTGLN